MNVLFITYGVPYPPHSGARVRDFFLLRELAKHHRITCLVLTEEETELRHIPALEQLGIATRAFSSLENTRTAQMRSIARHLAARYPLATLAFWSAPLFDAVRQVTGAQPFDLVQIEHSFLAPYLDALPPHLRRRSVLDLHNIGAVQYQRLAHLARSVPGRAFAQFKAQLMQNWEVAHAARFARVLTVSQGDAKWLCSRNPSLAVSVIENGTDTTGNPFLPPSPERNALLFVGTLGYPPNADAMLWFCREILPLIQARVPDVSLEIVGRSPGAEVQALANRQGVRLTADVSDTRPYYAQANVVIVPLRAGGGTRLKILEAMAFGRALVSTPIGSEGLAVEDGETLLLADTAHEFAARVIYLLQYPAERERLARNARAQAQERYAWEHIGAKLLGVYDEVARHAL